MTEPDPTLRAEPRPEEADEPELAELPRLMLHFNRRSLGRLRQLVDALNGRAEPRRHP